MNKTLTTILCATVLFGCRTKPVTPEESWSDYCRYYSATGETADAPTTAPELQVVNSKQVDATVEALKAQGYVVLGSFKISDGTDITRNAVAALAEKLNAGAVVWSPVTTSSLQTSLPNADLGIAGVDYTQAPNMRASRPDQSFAEQTMSAHTIYMLGKKK